MVALFGNRCNFGRPLGMLKIREKHYLMIDVIKGSVINWLSLRTRVGTLSILRALLEGIAFMTSATCLQST